MKRSVPVAITGMGALCAAGLDVASCMKTLFSGTRNPGPPKRFANEQNVAYPVFELDDAFYAKHPRQQGLFDTTLFAHAAAEQALEQAGYATEHLHGLRVGVCLGTTVGAALNFLTFFRQERTGRPADMTHIRRYLDSNPAMALSTRLGVSGPTQTVVNACSSGTDAIGLAAGWIRHGICDIVLAGGADELSEITYNGFARLMNTDATPCKPFDANRKGLNLGEGAAMLVLESESVRLQRGATPIAHVAGYGTRADAYHLTAPRPDGQGLRMALDDALAQSGITEERVSFVNVHGTATPNNDATEAAVLRERLPGAFISATKGCTGHTLGAAGALEAVFTCECLSRGELPPSTGCETPDPELGVVPVLEKTALKGSHAISQSLAFGGNNSVLVLSSAEEGVHNE